MIDTVRRVARKVDRWQFGEMCLRWSAAGMLEAQSHIRKIIGYTDLTELALAAERAVVANRANDTPTTTNATAAAEVAVTPA